jgi:hypothetical protein
MAVSNITLGIVVVVVRKLACRDELIPIETKWEL